MDVDADGEPAGEVPRTSSSFCNLTTCDQSEMEVTSADNLPPPKVQDTRDSMLDRIANTDAHFKHQQRGDPDLTFEEKRAIAGDILDKNAGTFLERYGKYLSGGDLSYFEKLSDNYTVDFYLRDIKKRLSTDSKAKVTVRNRRYQAMKHLVDSGEYFSDREMKFRDPLLYEQMVGQYLTEDEVQAQIAEGDGAISTLLFDHIEAIHNNELYAKQVQLEVSQQEEAGDSDDSEEESEMEDEDDEGRKLPPPISDSERLLLRNEFTAVMQQRFIHGMDEDFNYQDVDENVEYDCLEIRTQDEEEQYFDEEEPREMGSQASGVDGDIASCSSFRKMQIKETCSESRPLSSTVENTEQECCVDIPLSHSNGDLDTKSDSGVRTIASVPVEGSGELNVNSGMDTAPT